MESSAIEHLECYEYRPAITERLNEWGADFCIEAYNDDVVTQPSKSCVVFHGKITVTDATTELPIGNLNNHLWFVCNGIMHAFDRVEYQLGRTKVDDILKPGITMVMKGIPSISRYANYTDAGWYADGRSAPILDKETGEFHIAVPLSLMFGIHDDYKGYIYRMPQRLIFTKNSASMGVDCVQQNPDDRPPGVTFAMTLEFDDIVWRMPQIKFNPVYDAKIKAQILKGTDYQINFRHWLYNYMPLPVGAYEYLWDFPVSYARAKWVLVWFHHNRSNQWKKDMSQCDPMDIKSAQVQLNNDVYFPRERPSWDLAHLKYTSLYEMFKNFQHSYYSREDGFPLYDYKDFKQYYPIICIDCSRKPDVLKEALINVKIRFEWRTAIPERCVVHCVIISDSKVKYNPLHMTVIA